MSNVNGHAPKSERVAIYLRVSSEEQREAGTIQTQAEVGCAYAERMSFEVVKTYADDGISGTIPLHERPGGRRLLEDAKEGEFAAVLVYRLDRLGRSLYAIMDAHERLDKLGVGLISASEQIDTTSPSGRLHFQVLASVAEFEKASIVQRTKDGVHRKHREGRYMGPIPFGYRADGAGKLEIDPMSPPSLKICSSASRTVARSTRWRSGSTISVSSRPARSMRPRITCLLGSGSHPPSG